MAVYQNQLYVAGRFDAAAGNAGNNIQKWDGTSWSAVGGGTGGANGSISAMKVFHNKLYVTGAFTTAGSMPTTNVATWDGTNWCQFLDTFALGCPIAIETFHDTIYVGGSFKTINGDTVNNIAKWIGGNYTANCTTTGISEIENKEEISIYPNPSTGDFTINLNKENKNVEIETTNLLGQKIYTTKQKEKSIINITLNEPPGVYFLNVKTDERREVIKLVKE